MQLTINRKAFVKALETAKRAVETKTTIPILSNVLLSADGDALTITGTDLDLSIIATCPALITEAGATTVPAAQLLKAAKLLTAESFDVETDGATLAIICGRARMEFPTMARDSYPELPAMPGARATIAADAFAEAVARTQFAISTEESRFTLNGAQIEWNGSFRMVSTDGHRLSVVERAETATPHHFKAIMPKCFMLEVARLDGDMMEYSQDENHVFARIGSVTVMARKLTGNFPDYERVMRQTKESTREGVVNAAELAAILKRALPFACERSHAVRVEFADGELSVTASAVGSGTYRESMPMQYTGTPITFGYNAGYLGDYLRTVAGEITMHPGLLPRDATVLSPVGSNAYKHIVMPMRD